MLQKRAKEMGSKLYVVVSDRDPGKRRVSPSPDLMHHCGCLWRLSETASAAERFNRKIRKIDGIICVAGGRTADSRDGQPAKAQAARHLHRDRRARLRQARHEAPLCWKRGVPRAVVHRSFRPFRNCSASPSSAASNLVIKPVDSRGSRGFNSVAQVEDLTKAFALARSHSPDPTRHGRGISRRTAGFDGINRHQRASCYTPGFSDRNSNT